MAEQMTPEAIAADDAYAIIKNEPEGWLKAFSVTKNGEHVAWFRYRDSAEAYIADHTD